MNASEVMHATTERPQGRSFLPDLLKAVGCVVIVLHHLAFYGPMADVVAKSWPELIDGLARHGRLAVQLFLVCSGFLMASVLTDLRALSASAVSKAVLRRYLRLAIPLMAALSLTVIISELIRPGFAHGSLSDPPHWGQVLAHVFFLQHLLEHQALSAGVWYVAIDLQLYLGALLAAWLARRMQLQGWGAGQRWQFFLVLSMMVGSITYWTHQDGLDDTALFFWGAYGMGWLAWHARRHAAKGVSFSLWLALCVLCLGFDERGRAITAWAAAALLSVAPQAWLAGSAGQGPQWRWFIHWLSRISYGVFVVHFGICLLVNFAVHAAWPLSPVMNAAGMALALCLSLLAGDRLHRLTENGPITFKRWLTWSAAFMASAGLAMWLQA